MARAQDSTDLSAEEQTSSPSTASPSAESPNSAQEEFKVEPHPEENGGQASPQPLPQDAPTLQAPPTLQPIDSPSPEQLKAEPEPFRRELPKVKLPKVSLPVADPAAPNSPAAPPERGSGFTPLQADQPAPATSEAGTALSGGPAQRADQPDPAGRFVSKSLPIDVDVRPEAAPANVGADFPSGPSQPVRSSDAPQASPPKPPAAFAMPLPSPKRRSRARGQFTPAFRAGMLRLTVLLCILVGLIGVGWYKHWFPWMHTSKKITVSSWAGGASNAPPPRTLSPTPAETPTAGLPTGKDPATLANATSTQQNARLSNADSLGKNNAESPSTPKNKARPVVQPTTLAKHSSVRSFPAKAVEPAAHSPREPVLVPPKLIKSVRAVASLDDLRDFETGSVVIDALVGVSGDVTAMNVLSGPPSLRRPALDALKNYKYEPAKLGDKPVPAHVTVTMQFHFE